MAEINFCTIMVLKQKDILAPALKKELQDYVYDIIGYMIDVSKELPCGLPEYIYQEAFDTILREHNIDSHKEYRHYPLFHGKRMDSFLRMDFMVERSRGNIVIECKALDKITNHERQQLFSYMIASEFPIGLLVTFAHYPTPYIERYYFDKKDMTVTAF